MNETLDKRWFMYLDSPTFLPSFSPLPCVYRWFINAPFIKFSVIGIMNPYTTKHDLTIRVLSGRSDCPGDSG